MESKEKWNEKIESKSTNLKERVIVLIVSKRSLADYYKEKKYCCACYRKILEELEWDRLLISSAQQTLNDYRWRVTICQCLENEKPRIIYLNSDGSGWSRCERCEKIIDSAGHHRIVKNRNNPRFWGVESEWKALCLECIGKEFYREMEEWQRKKFREYVRRGYR